MEPAHDVARSALVFDPAWSFQMVGQVKAVSPRRDVLEAKQRQLGVIPSQVEFVSAKRTCERPASECGGSSVRESRSGGVFWNSRERITHRVVPHVMSRYW